MNSTQMWRKLRGWSLICLLVGVAFCSSGCKESKGVSEKQIESLPQIESAVVRLLSRYQIDEKSVKSRRVASGDKTFVRIERRASVPPEFNTLGFNHDLSEAVSEFGASVIATEKSEDKSVTMHIKKDNLIVESIVFVVKQD